MASEDVKAEAREREREREETRADDETLRARLQGAIPDALKRAFYAGIGAVFTTEEGVRKMVSDFSLPKDAANYLITQAQGTKNELFRVVASELRGWLEKIDIQGELTRMLTMVSVEVKTEIRFIPNDQALVKPEIKRKVSIKRARKPEDGAEESTDEPPIGAEGAPTSSSSSRG